MDNFFSSITNGFDFNGIGTAGVVAIVAVIIAIVGLWAWYVETNWVRYSLSNNRSDRNELLIALLAPVAVPAILVVAALKAHNIRTASREI